MKKLFFVVLIGLALGTAAFADHPDGIGLGGVTSGGISIHDGVYPNLNFGLSLKPSPLPIFLGLYSAFIPGYSGGFGVTGDYYLFDNWNLVDKIATNEDGDYHVKIDWYLGFGLFANMSFAHKYTGLDLGVRVPFGVSWHAMKQLEVTVGIAPGMGLYTDFDKGHFHTVVPLEIACRYWFDSKKNGEQKSNEQTSEKKSEGESSNE